MMNDVNAHFLRVLVVDHVLESGRSLQSLLAPHPELEVVGQCATGPEAVESIERTHPELVLMDVHLPGFDGFEVLRRANAAVMPEVIFITAYSEHALRAFDVQAVDYLVKPFENERFNLALERAKARVRQKRLESLLLRSNVLPFLERLAVREAGRIQIVHVCDIDWIEAEDYYVELHVGQRAYLLRERMHTLEARLDSRRFARIHRSSIVNVDRVKELQPVLHGEYTVLLRDGTRLKLTRNYRDRLKLLLGVASLSKNCEVL